MLINGFSTYLIFFFPIQKFYQINGSREKFYADIITLVTAILTGLMYGGLLSLASYKLAEFHNAQQLSAWCLHFMAINYNVLCKEQSQEIKSLEPKTLQYLEKNQWPPLWYLKEQDYYEESMAQLEREKNIKKKKKQRQKYSGCF